VQFALSVVYLPDAPRARAVSGAAVEELSGEGGAAEGGE
jgi:hypothetical protein